MSNESQAKQVSEIRERQQQRWGHVGGGDVGGDGYELSDIDYLLAQLEETQRQLASLESRWDENVAEVKAHVESNISLRQQLAAAEKQLGEQWEPLISRVRNSKIGYSSGPTS